MKNLFFLSCLLSFFIFSCKQNQIPEKVDLSGEWRLSLDPDDKGISGEWFTSTLSEKILLPGSLTSNGKGYDVSLETSWTGRIADSSFYTSQKYAKYREPGNIKIPFWLQPLKYYKGAAWYQKEVRIPKNWKGKQVQLFLERCHWETRLWVDEMEMGLQNSLGTPHIYDLSTVLKPGKKHRLTICVDNRIKDIDVGHSAHSITDHTQSNWNGITGRIYLKARPAIYISNIKVFPDIHGKRITARMKVVNATGESGKISVELFAEGKNTPAKQKAGFVIGKDEDLLEMDYFMGEDMQVWSEFQPSLYTLTAVLNGPDPAESDTFRTSFGMREFKTEGRHFLMNGQRVFTRGTLECAIFPKTGFPPADVESWARIIRICKDHGLNHIRFHSWCPPEAAFIAADQAGFYYQVEASIWTQLGNGKPVDQFLYDETDRILEHYGNHPSFVMMVAGNEIGGANRDRFLASYVAHYKSKDPRRLYTTTAGRAHVPENDYHNSQPPRIQGYSDGLKSIINREPPRSDYDWSEYISAFSQPVVSHEIGQWCAYPNFREIPKYDGVLRARNFEIFQETLAENGMRHLADSFLLASGKLQTLCFKADVEAALRTKDFGGFHLLSLNDFPGQGTALVGILDAFWDEKGYVKPDEFRRFCNTTVPLARMKKHIYRNNENFSVPVEVAHFGPSELKAVTPVWKVTNRQGQIVKEGKFSQTDIPLGNGFSLGNISFSIVNLKAPEQFTLEVTVDQFANNWHFWVYPSKKEFIPGSESIVIAREPDDATMKILKEGGIVLLSLKLGTLADDMGGDVKAGFSSIFWNTAWTRGRAPHTLGILCDPGHPALAEFPTQYHSNWQWWDAMSHSGTVNLSSFPVELKPIVRVIDDWFTNRPLALLFEAKVGKGKLLVSGIDFHTDMAKRPEAEQLLYSLKKYMAGDRFNPKVSVQEQQIRKFMK